MDAIDLNIKDFNLRYTLECGQVFRWSEHNGWYYGVVKDKIIKIAQTKYRVLFQIYPEDNDFGIEEYFRLDDDLQYIRNIINKDEIINKAINQLTGLRLIRQDPWECLISYVCSKQNKIPKIKTTIFNLSKNFGQKIQFDNKYFYTFPKPTQIVNADLEDLVKCNFRFGIKQASEIQKIAKLVLENKFDLEKLEKLDYYTGKERLMSLHGVGHKIADCVLLFSLDKLEAFPVDTWIRKIMQKYYFLKNSSDDSIRSFARSYFGKYAGYAQEYLYYYFRGRI